MTIALLTEARPLPAVPKVSVVMPTFNSMATVAEAIDSVVAQNHPNIELLVIDDGSSDDTIALIRCKYPWVTIHQQKNSGAASARNLGLQESCGDLIAFLDADDVWFEGKLHAQIEAFKRDPKLGFVFTDWLVGEQTPDWNDAHVRAQTAQWPSAEANDPALSGWLYTALLSDVVIHTSTLLIRRELLQATGFFNISLRRGQDYDYWLRMSRHAPGLKLKRPFSLYRQHAGSAIRKPQPRNYAYEVLSSALRQWGTRGPDGSTIDAALLRTSLARACRDFAHLHAHNGSGRISLRYAAQAIVEDPRDVRNVWAALKIAVRATLRTAG